MTYPTRTLRHCSRCKESGTDLMIIQVGDEYLCDQCMRKISGSVTVNPDKDEHIWGLGEVHG